RSPAGGGAGAVPVVPYGGPTALVERAMQALIEEHELRFDYIVLTELWPLDVTEIADSVARTGRLVVVEENVAEFGIGSAVIAAVAPRGAPPLTSRPLRRPQR